MLQVAVQQARIWWYKDEPEAGAGTAHRFLSVYRWFCRKLRISSIRWGVGGGEGLGRSSHEIGRVGTPLATCVLFVWHSLYAVPEHLCKGVLSTVVFRRPSMPTDNMCVCLCVSCRRLRIYAARCIRKYMGKVVYVSFAWFGSPRCFLSTSERSAGLTDPFTGS